MHPFKLVLLLLLIILYSCKNREANNYFNEANELYNKENFADASLIINKAIKLDSSDIRFHFLNAKIKYKNKQYKESINLFEKCLSNNIELDTTLFFLGKNYYELAKINANNNQKLEASKNYETAIKYFNQTLNKNIKYLRAYDFKYRSLHNIGNQEEALLTINQALNIFPKHSFFIGLRGIVKRYLGDKEGGFNDLILALNSNSLTDSERSNLLRFKGLFFILDYKNYQEALTCLTRSIEFKNENQGLTYYLRSIVYFELNETEKACNDLQKSGELGYTDAYEELKYKCLN
ncbi:hypothetical protein [Formosa sp. A9]|uniref:tetratricopeptide repeat protein n=1 Tax=Formosa sp. A9 TaxID=3442641 RepID=UPI003EBFEF13